MPELKDLLDVTIAGFKVDKLTDQGLSVTKIDADGDKVAPVTERNWLVNLVADSTGEPAATFAFPKPKLASAELSYKRYADADIVDVKAELALAGVPIRPRSHRGWYFAAAIVVVCGGGLYLLLRSGKTAAVEQVAAYTLPAQVTPFTVLNLLRRMEQDHQLPMPVERRDELARAIRELEQDYFGPAGETNGQANLERIAREWLVSAAT